MRMADSLKAFADNRGRVYHTLPRGSVSHWPLEGAHCSTVEQSAMVILLEGDCQQ
jgi:hypothetical protein